MSRSLQNPLKIVEHMQRTKTSRPLKTTATPKLQRARQILEREESNAKRSRLESMLVQQYVGKFGSRNPNSKVNQVIKNCVRGLLSDYGDDISNAQLDSIERKVREVAQYAKEDILTGIEEEKMQKTREEQQIRAERMAKTHNSAAQGSVEEERNCELNQWAVVNAMMAINDKEDRQKEQRKLQERKINFKKDLDRQVQMREAQQAEIQAKKKQELQAVASAYEEYKKEEVQAKHERDAKLLVERELKMQQIQENKIRIAKEREAKIAQERREMERAKNLQLEEARRIAEKKEREKRQMDVVKLENETNKAIKAEQKREQAEYEKKLNSDYELRLAKEEMERTSAFSKRMEKLGQASKKFEESTGAAIAQQKELNEQKVMQEIKLKEQRDEQRETEKRDKRQRDLMEATKFNFEMAQRKKEKERMMRENDIKVRLASEAAYREAIEEEKREKAAKMKKMNELKDVLDGQCEIRKKNIRNAQILSEEEQLLNKSIIQKIEKDPDLKRKVVNAVVPTASNYSSFAW